MRVVNANRAGIEDAENQVIDALRAWRVPGIAVSGVRVPRAGGKATERQLLLVLPYAVVVTAAYLVPQRLGGVFRCPAHGKWSLSYEEDGAPIHKEFDNQLPALLELMGGLQGAAEGVRAPAPLVTGRVIVVPWNFPVTLEKVGLPTAEGLDVLLFDPRLSELRTWADGHAQDQPVWTAEDTLALLARFGVTADSRDEDSRVTLQELVDIGFPRSLTPRIPSTKDPALAVQSTEVPPRLPVPPQAIPPPGNDRSAQEPPAESGLQKINRRVSSAMPKTRGRQQLALAGVAAAVWLGLMAVMGPALTPDHGTGTGSVTPTTSVPGAPSSSSAPK